MAWALRTGGLVLLAGLLLPLGTGGQETSTSRREPATDQDVQLLRFLDSNRDRRVSADELALGQDLAAVLLMLSFNECDRDQDGSLELPELSAATAEARQELALAESEEELEAQEDLARAVSLQVLLERLAGDDRYAQEIAALREAVENLDDEDAVITYITQHPKLYPHLGPVIRVWGRYYPVRPELRRHFWRRPPHRPTHLKPLRPAPKPRAHPPKPAPRPKPKPKPGPRPRRPGP